MLLLACLQTFLYERQSATLAQAVAKCSENHPDLLINLLTKAKDKWGTATHERLSIIFRVTASMTTVPPNTV